MVGRGSPSAPSAVAQTRTFRKVSAPRGALGEPRPTFWRANDLGNTPEWCWHLRPYNKRRVAKKERRAANRIIQDTRENKTHPAEN